jgi:hypothetical protein
LATGVAVVCLAAARCVGVGVRWQLVVEEEGAGARCGEWVENPIVRVSNSPGRFTGVHPVQRCG